jgi:hypothetical protein
MMNVIVLPAGTYDFSGLPPIALPSDVRLVGSRVTVNRGTRKAALHQLLPIAADEQLERVLGHEV